MLEFQHTRNSLAAALCAGLIATAAGAQSPASATAVRIQQAPRVDGRLTEEIWRTAPAVTGFVQREPNEGAPAPDKTEIRFAYDDDALYVGLRMFSRDPKTIRALVTRRDDETSSESSCISLDTYRDRRTAYSFCVTPAGVRLEFYHASDDMDDGDSDWNPVWEANARIDSAGWAAEMRIPFSQLRFSAATVQEWGLNAVRFIPARNEESFWVLVKRTENGWSSRMGALTGISGIRPSRQIEALPYIAADSRSAAEFDPLDPFNKQYRNRARLGGDVKVGLGPNMTLDLTINPDFGQVEADPAEVNLSAYETFFGERRPFFLEGSDLLGQRDLFYSRRIGAQPPGSANADYVERLSNTTILGAGKLTGQLKSGLTIAALAAVTDRESVRTFDTATAVTGSTVVAPRTGYAVAGARQQYGEDASSVSGLITAVRRDMDANDPLANLVSRSAYSGVLDWRQRWAGGKYDFNAYFGFSSVLGDSVAILRLQRSSRRYYQRPDADHVDVDSALTSLGGTIFSLSHSKMSGKHWLWDVDFHQQSPGFEPNDAGAYGAVDNRSLSMGVRWRETKPTDFYRRWEVGINAHNQWNFDGVRRNNEKGAFFSVVFPNYWQFSYDTYYAARALSDRLTRGGPLMGTPASGGWSMEVEGREGSRTSWSVDMGYERDENGSWEQSVELNLGFNPSDRLTFSFDPEWSRSRDSRQFIQTEVGGRPETFGTRYIFGRVLVSEISTQFRMNYSFTPNLTLETYAQPFAASGYFSAFGELAAAGDRNLFFYGTSGAGITRNSDGSHTVTDGGQSFDIEPLDFNERSLRTNAVLRWEWRPGSTLYLVWQQNRERERPFSEARPQHVFQSFDARADNFLALKVSYWIPVR
jgi:hypothetical protein